MACWLRRCHECGFPLGRKVMTCPRCGAKQRREKLTAILAIRADTPATRGCAHGMRRAK